MDTEIKVSTECWPWRRKFLLPEIEPATFRSRGRRSTTELFSRPSIAKITNESLIHCPCHTSICTEKKKAEFVEREKNEAQ